MASTSWKSGARPARRKAPPGMVVALEHGDRVAGGDERGIGEARGAGADHGDAHARDRACAAKPRLAPGPAVDDAADPRAAAHFVDAGVAGKAATRRLAARELRHPFGLGHAWCGPSAMKSALPASTAAAAIAGIAQAADRDHGDRDLALDAGGIVDPDARRGTPSAAAASRPRAASGNARRRCGARRRRPRPPSSAICRPRDRACPRGNNPRPTGGRSRGMPGTAAFTARRTSRPKRARFSRLPPYSSVRRFSNGVWNCEMR